MIDMKTYNKKLRCREEHSASVMLSWCTVWHFSGDNRLMANQPLLQFYIMGTESYWIRWNNIKITAITPFKVIQGHQFQYHSKARMQLPISE